MRERNNYLIIRRKKEEDKLLSSLTIDVVGRYFGGEHAHALVGGSYAHIRKRTIRQGHKREQVGHKVIATLLQTLNHILGQVILAFGDETARVILYFAREMVYAKKVIARPTSRRQVRRGRR
jgi:hypothetical protein